MFDAAILAAGVHRLHHHQHPVPVLGVEHLLQLLELVLQFIELRVELAFPGTFEQGFLAAFEALEFHLCSRLHPISFQSSTDWHGWVIGRFRTHDKRCLG